VSTRKGYKDHYKSRSEGPVGGRQLGVWDGRPYQGNGWDQNFFLKIGHLSFIVFNLIFDFMALLGRQALRWGWCYDSPWTGLLTSGDGSCHQWTAVGVRVTPLERCLSQMVTYLVYD